MDLNELSFEELEQKKLALKTTKDIRNEYCKRIATEIKEYEKEIEEIQKVIDDKVFEELESYEFIDLIQYLLNNGYEERTTNYRVKLRNVFGALKLEMGMRSKSAHFHVDLNFIQNNRKEILEYLPLVFNFCLERKDSTQASYHVIHLGYSKYDSVWYFPENKNYLVCGADDDFIVHTLEEVLDWLVMEKLKC